MILKLFLLASFCLLFGSLTGQNTLDTAWVNSYGGNGRDVGRDIKETQDHGFILVGETTSFGSAQSSFYVIRTDSIGKRQWSWVLGSGINNFGRAVEVTSDGYYLTGFGNFGSDLGYEGMVIKCDQQGKFLWEKHYGGNDWDYFYNSCLFSAASLIVCGESYREGAIDSDLYIARLTSAGDTLWTKRFGTSGNDALYECVAYGPFIYAVGKVFNSATGQTEAYICKIDSLGNLLFEDKFSANSNESFQYNDIAMSKAGDLILGGKRSFGDTNHYIIRRVDPSNLSENAYNTFTHDYFIRTITEGDNSDIYIAGPKIGGSGGFAAYYSRLDTDFQYIEGANFGGSNDEDVFEFINTSRGFAFIGFTRSYGNNNLLGEPNFYLVIFNKDNLVSEYFLMLNEHKDNPLTDLPSVSEYEKTNVFPNPFDISFSLMLAPMLQGIQDVQCSIYNSIGECVYHTVLTSTVLRHVLEFHESPSGIYTLRLNQPNSEPINLKLLKK